MACTKHKNKHSRNKSLTVDLDTCALCLGSDDDVEQYGKFFRCSTKNLGVHEYCLFFASGLAQNGEDNEGFDGFLFEDIVGEIKRASKLRCTICHLKGAAVGCNINKCGSAFHFKCGLKKHALFQFFGSFCAFCKKHRPTQNTLVSYAESMQHPPVCPICLSDVDRADDLKSLKSPCCKNAWFHRSCIQKQALANGMYFFRCSFCNNLDQFQEEMRRMGIYIPDRDAIWEQGDAYNDLLQQYNRCDAETCLCPKGREYSGKLKNKRWKIFRCFACGQSGTHRDCQGSYMHRKWLCPSCVVCFPKEKDALNRTLDNTLTNTANESEQLSLDDSQSTVNLDSEIPKDFNSPSTDLEDNLPLSHLVQCCKDRMNVKAGAVVIGIGDTGASKDSSENSNSLFANTGGNSRDSSQVDIDNSSTDSSLISSFDTKKSKNGLLKNISKGKRKGVKRKKVNNGYKKSLAPSTRTAQAEKRAIREQYTQRRQLQEDQAKMEELENNQDERVENCIGKNERLLDKSANDSFCLLLSSESESQEEDLLRKSPHKNDKIPSQSSSEEFAKPFTVSKASLDDILIGSVNIKSDKINQLATDSVVGGTASICKTESSSNKDSLSPSKSSECSETSVSNGKKRLLQRDIRHMFLSGESNNARTSPSANSPAKIVEDQSCQTSPIKRRRVLKRRKLSTHSGLSDSKSITSFMSINNSSPKRKSPKRIVQDSSSCAFEATSALSDQTENTVSTVSGILETMTAAKGMVMRALRRLSLPSEMSEQNDNGFPYSTEVEMNSIEDGDCESIDSGPTLKSSDKTNDVSSPLDQAPHKEDTDSDSSDSIKIVKVKKGRGLYPRGIPLIARKCKLPSDAHENHCECYRPQVFQVIFKRTTGETSKEVDPGDVIVIDDESDEHDSGKGSSRETSDAGMKSCEGSGAEDLNGIPSIDDKDYNLCYSSCESEVPFRSDNDGIHEQTRTELSGSLQDGASVEDSSEIKNSNSSSDNQESKTSVKELIQGSEKVSKKCKSKGEKLTKVKADQLNPIPSVLFEESLENSYFSENSIEECLSDNSFSSLDYQNEKYPETNFKGVVRKTGKSLSRKSVTSGSLPNGLSPLKQKSKLNLPNRKFKTLESRKKLLGLRTYMDRTDEDFQTKKKKFTSKAKKSVRNIKTCLKNEDEKKRLKKQKLEKKNRNF